VPASGIVSAIALSSRAGAQEHAVGSLGLKVAADPFFKVKKLIIDMITLLPSEANSDASHEGVCDKEMGQSKLTRNRLNEEVRK
jgi:hypothetical protein